MQWYVWRVRSPRTSQSSKSEMLPEYRQIAATDRQIDRLVYELYELTEEEIALVEGATG